MDSLLIALMPIALYIVLFGSAWILIRKLIKDAIVIAWRQIEQEKKQKEGDKP